jgi:DNA-binding beta-propeller fold protein YncE
MGRRVFSREFKLEAVKRVRDRGVAVRAAPNGKGWVYVNNEKKNTIQIVDVGTWKAIKSWPVAPCESPTGIAYDRSSDRIFVG